MGAKHTPGPWSVYVGKDGQTVQVEPGDKAHGVRPAIVFWTGFDANDMPPAVNVANARLIAAAPSLLDALEALEQAVSEYGREPGEPTPLEEDMFDAAQAARSVIRQATGA